jgi:hypothetical protein
MSTTAKSSEVIELLPQFIKALNQVQPEYSSADRIWQLPLRTGDKPTDWVMLRVAHYQETYYLSWTLCDLAVELDSRGRLRSPASESLAGEEMQKLAHALKHFNRQVRQIKRDWVNVYRRAEQHFPLAMRYGTLPKAILWEYYPDTYRVDTELGKALTGEFIAQVRAHKFQRDGTGHHKEMTLALYMRYCEVAYHANVTQPIIVIEPGTSVLDMYRWFADGRDDGLTKLPPDSAEDFSKWFSFRRGGGHPWEIHRGGNTTHIDLGVCYKHQNWSVFLEGSSTTRMAETIRIAVALTKASLPVEIYDAEKLVLRLLGMDNIGLIPDDQINHRAARYFDAADKVFDCAHLRDLPRNNRILPFVTWKPLAPLRPLMISPRSRPIIKNDAGETSGVPG